jgi:hypothetical protein
MKIIYMLALLYEVYIFVVLETLINKKIHGIFID